MKRVLIISTLYSQMQHVKTILERHASEFQVCGTADNSVLGMSLIESTRPDLVVMPVHMNFWNAEDLINYLLPRGICPTFVLLLDDGEPAVGPTASTKVAAILPSSMPTDVVLVRAMLNAAERQSRDQAEVVTPHQTDNTVEHSMEVMELLLGLNPMQTREAQQKFGRLRVGKQDCWVLLGAPAPDRPEPFYFLSQMTQLNQMFQALTVLLKPLGDCEICIYQDENLCILLTGNQRTEPDWGIWVQEINRLLEQYGFPCLVFDISDMPLPLNRWPDQCRELRSLRKLRFFYSPPYLQPKMMKEYEIPVSQSVLHARLSALSLSMQNLNKIQVQKELDALQELVTHSLSRDIYSYAVTQILIQYNSLCYSFGIKDRGEAITLKIHQVRTLDQIFHLYREMLLLVLDQVGHYGSSSNQLVTQVCRYINDNLAEPLTLEVVSAQVHVNATYLSRLFKKEVGTTFNSYISQLRIQRAAKLLETGRKITDISGMVGFENAKYFSQVFKKQIGMTPQEYRQLHRKENTP